MENIYQKCNKDFLNLHKGVNHQCWNKTNNDSGIKNEAFNTYRCPACGRFLFKGNISSLAMSCPECNEFMRIPKTDS